MERSPVRKLLLFFLLTVLPVGGLFLSASAFWLALILPFTIAACFAILYLTCGVGWTAAGVVLFSGVAFWIAQHSSETLIDAVINMLAGGTVIALTGVIVGYLIQRKKGMFTVMVAAGAGFLLSNGGYMLLMNLISGTNPVSEFLALLQPAMVSELEQSLTQLGMQDYASQAAAIYQQFANSLMEMFPTLILITSACMGYLLTFVVSLLLKITKNEHQLDFWFSRFKADAITVVIFFIALMVTFFIKDGVLSVVFYNIYMILMFALQICGLSILDYMMKYRKNWKLPMRLLLIGVLFVLSLIPLVSGALLIFAAIDSRRDFRKLTVPPEDPDAQG